MSKSTIMNYEDISSKDVFTIDPKDIVLRELRLENSEEFYHYKFSKNQ